MTDKMADQIFKGLSNRIDLSQSLLRPSSGRTRFLMRNLMILQRRLAIRISKLIFNEIVDSENGH